MKELQLIGEALNKANLKGCFNIMESSQIAEALQNLNEMLTKSQNKNLNENKKSK